MNKYGAKRIVVDGINFHSIGESKRYQDLKLLEKAGKISELQCQPIYKLNVNNILICKYIADFFYYDNTNKKYTVEDYKGRITDLSRLKIKLFKALYPEYNFIISTRNDLSY